MFELTRISCAVYLCILSIMDIWVKRVPLWFLAAGGIAAVWLCVLKHGATDISAMAGAAVGVLFIVVSRMTREAFGYGDSLLILVMGIYLGFRDLMAVLLSAFLLSALFAIALLACKRFHKNTGYPFIPFLLAAYFIWMWAACQ